MVVDDELAVLRVHERILRGAGYEVDTATDGVNAEAKLRRVQYDVIVSDIQMPGLDGLALLRAARACDLDVPVVFVTGAPTLETATRAVEYGALLYLLKPVPPRVLVEVVNHAVQLHRLAKLKRGAIAHMGGDARQLGDRASLEFAFARALDGLTMAYQPIVSWPERKIVAYEALLRSSEPLLPTPPAVLEAGERLGRLNEIGRATRALVGNLATQVPEGCQIFVNLHPNDLNDPELYAPTSPLTAHAEKIVLEVTERANLDKVSNVRARIDDLRRLGFRIALDDLGAGYGGLSAFAELKPDVVKLDMSLVRDIHLDEVKQRLVGSMVSICHDMKLSIVAEGVETPEERDTLIQLGCDLLQGYLFAKPAKPFPTVQW